MNVIELRDRLTDIINHTVNSAEYDVKIPIIMSSKSMGGPTPSVKITGISTGFDWNRGIVFLNSNEKLKINYGKESKQN